MTDVPFPPRPGVLRISEGELVPFPVAYVPPGECLRVTLRSNATMDLLGFVLPTSPQGLLWSDWFIEKDGFLNAARDWPHDRKSGVSLDRPIEYETRVPEQTYHRVELEIEETERRPRLGIGQSWGIELYNPTAATVPYAGAAAVVRRRRW